MKLNLLTILLAGSLTLVAQVKDKTTVRGFIDIGASYDIDKERMGFQFGEQDLFITSDLSDKISFLGESVLKYSPTSPTKFDISLERAIFKYNYYKNHNFFAGKVHTAINYWNDTYHHGRLFFPTVGRPELFNQNIIPLHTTGFGLSGHDLGNLKIGYTFMIGNGLGSTDLADNNAEKCYVFALHFKPIDGLRVGGSVYWDKIDGVVHDHGGGVKQAHNVRQGLYSGSIAFFRKKIELLAEATSCQNMTDSIGVKTTYAAYGYLGFRIKDMFVPYVRYDNVDYEKGEMYFTNVNTEMFTVGLRYEVNYLTSIKLEYQYKKSGTTNPVFTNNMFLQFAIGF